MAGAPVLDHLVDGDQEGGVRVGEIGLGLEEGDLLAKGLLKVLGSWLLGVPYEDFQVEQNLIYRLLSKSFSVKGYYFLY